MGQIKVSIAMCTYNGQEYLKEQLQSILCQSIQPDELVVCDDRSSDATLEIIEDFKKAAPFKVKVYVNDTNLGSTKNFEKAITLCEGDIIFLADQDDVWHTEKLEKSLDVFKMYPETGIVFTDAEIVDSDLKPLGYTMWESIGFTKKEMNYIENGNPFRVLMMHNVVTGATMSFRRRFRECFLPIPKGWIHDAWITFIVTAVAELKLIHRPLIKYRQHPKQQIGGLRKDESFKWEEALRDNSGAYLREYTYYKTAFDRIVSLVGDNPEKEKLLFYVKDRLDFLQWRANRPSHKGMRVMKVAANVFKLRYHRYAKGFKSAVKDIILN